MAPTTTAAADLVLDGAPHQTWEGWGGCFNELGIDALALLPAADRAGIMHGLFHPQGELRLNIGRVPTNRISWDQPHEGNLFEFLYRRRSISVAA